MRMLIRHILPLLLTAALSAGALCQVSQCYTFDDFPYNGRPTGWGALPNLDYNYVGISQYDPTAYNGAHSLHVKGNVCCAIMPDEGFNYAADSLWLRFAYYLSMNTATIEVGYLTDVNDASTFHLLSTHHNWAEQWHHTHVCLASVPTGARIAFRSSDIMAGDGNFWIDNVYVTDLPCWLWNFHAAEIRVDSLRLEWQKAGNPGFSISWGEHTLYPTGTSITVPRNALFSSVIPYDVTYCSVGSFYSCQCRGGQGVHSWIRVLPYRETSCVSVNDGFSTAVVPYSGTPVNPYLNASTRTTTVPGASGIYAGSHTLTTSPNAEQGAGQMVFPMCIPPGDNATMRLGNRLGDWESAAVLYTLTVDTAESDLLVVKYTMAMNDGIWMSIGGGPEVEHADSIHPPRFRIELLDDTLGPLPPSACNLVALDGMSDLGWDSLDERNNSYSRRNFTARAFDLRPYQGQRVKLRITAVDGALNNRWCYAYYSTECLKMNDIAGNCSVDSVTITVPYGFRYRWYRDGTTSVVDSGRSVRLAADGTLWHCDLIDRHCADCSYTISRRVYRSPYVEVRDTLVENSLPHTFSGTVFYGPADTVLAVPADVGCDTMLHYSLHVWPNQTVRLERLVCPDEWPLVWQGHTFTQADSVTFVLTDCHGADSAVTLVAVAMPSFEVSDTILFCPKGPYLYLGVDYGGPASFDTLLATVAGCDSLVHVFLTTFDSGFTPRAFHSTDGVLWSDTAPLLLCEGETLFLKDSTEKSTAWRWTIKADDSLRVAEGRTDSCRFDLPVNEGYVLLEVESDGGCVDSLRWPLVVYQPPEAAFSWNPDPLADVAPEVNFVNLSIPKDGVGFLWLVQREEGGAAVDSFATMDLHYRWPGELPKGDFAVELQAGMDYAFLTDSLVLQHRCTDTARDTVKIVTACLQFPNAVTPNGDGVNDRWEVVGLLDNGLYLTNELWIYDRWGRLVYHKENIRQRDHFWDPNSSHSPSGSYFFHFLAWSDYGVVRRSGVIEVVR